jgi:uncharacterized membrane protein
VIGSDGDRRTEKGEGDSMSNLVGEILLRLAKAVAALLVGLGIFWVATAFGGETPSTSLFLLSWLSGAAFVLLVESSPI